MVGWWGVYLPSFEHSRGSFGQHWSNNCQILFKGSIFTCDRNYQNILNTLIFFIFWGYMFLNKFNSWIHWNSIWYLIQIENLNSISLILDRSTNINFGYISADWDSPFYSYRAQKHVWTRRWVSGGTGVGYSLGFYIIGKPWIFHLQYFFFSFFLLKVSVSMCI